MLCNLRKGSQHHGGITIEGKEVETDRKEDHLFLRILPGYLQGIHRRIERTDVSARGAFGGQGAGQFEYHRCARCVVVGAVVDVADRGTPAAEVAETNVVVVTADHQRLPGQGRIAAAAVQFPLAESDEVSIALGSRHRAAIGLSQESDALVLVVSEETGIISVIQNGNMQRNLTPESLRQILRTELVRKVEDADK